jgi:hypothetical protein
MPWTSTGRARSGRMFSNVVRDGRALQPYTIAMIVHHQHDGNVDRAAPGREIEIAATMFVSAGGTRVPLAVVEHLREAVRLVSILVPTSHRYDAEQAAIEEFLIRAEAKIGAQYNQFDHLV